MKILREPLLHFILIGAAIYGAYAIYGAPQEEAQTDERRIVIDKEMVDGFKTLWKARWYREPTEQELNGLISNYIRETMYYQEAVSIGLDKDDPVTKRRMAQKLEFLTKDVAALKQPAEGELESYYKENMDAYRNPDLISFTHIFIDPDKRGDATLDDADALLSDLKAVGAPDASIADKGDRFMLSNDFSEQSEQQITKAFGSGFTESLMQLQPGEWHGPVLSGYGTHLVYVSSLETASVPAFEEVREQVLRDWQEAQQEIVEQQFYEELKNRYEIVFEGVPPVTKTNEATTQEVADNKQLADRSGS
jgi:hypothetical protein